MQTSTTVRVGDIVQPSITVLSPNGGESWAKNTVQTIKWQDNSITPYPQCPAGQNCPQYMPALIGYDIKLAEYHTPCAGPYCPAYAYREPYTIVKGVTGTSYPWSVGRIISTDANAPDGSYTIQICQTGTSTCDSSDSSFQINPNYIIY